MLGAGQGRRLHLEFQRPLTGRGQITFELVPRIPLGSPVDLPLPSVLGDQVVRRSGADASASLLAFRTEDLQAQIAHHLRITGIDANEFRNFWVAAGLPDPGPSIHAFSFQRNPAGSQVPGGSAPLLRLQLQAASLANGAESGRAAWQDIHWLLKPRQADFTAQIHLSASSRELALVEYDLPPEIHLIDVTGPEVYAWSETPAASGVRNGPGANHSRLQIWLKGMFADTTFELAGWMKLEETPAGGAAPAPGAPAKVAPSNDLYLFPLPALRLLSATEQRILISIETRPGWTLKLANRKNMWPLPSSVPPRNLPSPTREGGSVEEFQTDRADYEGRFELRRSPAANPANSTKLSAKEIERNRRISPAASPSRHPVLLEAL